MTISCYHLGLIGFPLGHSRSPQLHLAALAEAKLAGDYQLFTIPLNQAGLNAMKGLVEDLCQGRLHGLNVTIPHKQSVIPYLDQLSLVARAVGAVNTLHVSGDGRVTGDNTDVPGFLWDVRRLVGAQTGSAVVLGAGGSARAVVYALLTAGWRVRILARRVEQANELAAEIGQAVELDDRLSCSSMDLKSLAVSGWNCNLLVNTTPLGMVPKTEGCPWPLDLPLPANSAVYDLVYNPLETHLIRMAKAARLPAANGAGMLIAQAALSFKRWTGFEPPFEVMENAFYRDAI